MESYSFEYKYALYYAGGTDRYVHGEGSITDDRILLQDVRGKTLQIPLVTINSVQPKMGIISRKELDIKTTTPAALVLTFKTKDDLFEATRRLNEAMAA